MEIEDPVLFIKIVNGHEMQIFLIMNDDIGDVDAMSFECLTCPAENNGATVVPIESLEAITATVKKIDEYALAHASTPL